ASLLRCDADDHRLAMRRVVVVVENRARTKAKPAPEPAPKPAPKPQPQPAVTSQSLADGQTVEGQVGWDAQVSGPLARVEFLVEGAVRATATAAPWGWTWDTSGEAPGQHAIAVRALAADGRSA